MANRKGEAKWKGRQKTNEVVLEQHYPSLLAGGTTFYPLKLLRVSGAVWELCLTQTTLNFKQIDGVAFQANESIPPMMSFTAERKREQDWERDTLAHEQSIKILSTFIFMTLTIIPFQVVHTLLVNTVIRLWSRNRLCWSSHCSVTKCNKWDSLSLCHKLQERDYRGCWHCITRSSKTDKIPAGTRDYSCPPSPSPSRSECHEFPNSSPGHDNRGGGRWGRQREKNKGDREKRDRAEQRVCVWDGLQGCGCIEDN